MRHLPLWDYYAHIRSHTQGLAITPSSQKTTAGCPRGYYLYLFPSILRSSTRLTAPQISLVSIGNTIQAHATTGNTAQVHANSSTQINPLASRIFGTWTFLSAVIRIYAAYNISSPQMYQIAIFAYSAAWVHFMSEWLIFGSAKLGRGLVGPLCISIGNLMWMLGQYDFT